MDKKLTRDVQRLLDSRHRDKRRGKVLQCLALLVVVATISALAMPALTLSNEVVCGMEEHVHTEECWSEEWITPQPALACEAELAGMTLIHTHNDYCYDAVGNLICTLPELEFHVHGPECYQERRELICQEPQSLGHTHDASCYAYDKGGLICGQEEGGGHTHSEECYPLERAAEPQCGMTESDDVLDEAGNVVTPGHHHSEECYMQRVFQKLRYEHEETEDVLDEEGNVVTPGHRHTAECWMTTNELVICGQKEGQGHTHSKECFEWVPRLVCQEEERPAGHVHDDSCYNVTSILTCQKQEVTVHTHTQSCYDENGALICGKPEIGEHQHTAACLAEPAGEPELVRVLTCGREEHTHGDNCYYPTEEEERTVYYCGKEEHIHTAECYFESGALKDTQEEHIHDLTCLVPRPEETGEPEPSEDPEATQDPEESGAPAEEEKTTGVMLEDYPYTYESETFTVTYHITGFARVADEEAQPAAEPLGVPYTEPAAYDGGSGQREIMLSDIEVPLSFRPVFQSLAAYFDSDPDSNQPPEYVQDVSPDSGQPPVTADGASGSASDPEGSAVYDSAPIPTLTPEMTLTPEWTLTPETTPVPEASPEPTAEPLDPALVEFSVEELAEDDPRYQAVMGAEGGEEDTILQQAIALNAAWNGRKLDLSECTITAVIKPTQALIEAVQSDAGVMSAAEDGASGGAGGEPGEMAEPALNVYSMNGRELTMPLSENAAETAESEPMQLSEDGVLGMTVNKEVYPDFTVRYVSQVKTVATDIDKAIENAREYGVTINKIDYDAVDTVIDTSGGRLPQNGANNKANMPTTTMYIKNTGEDKGSVLMRTDRQEIYKSRLFNYSTANTLKAINIVTGGGVGGDEEDKEGEQRETDHYVFTGLRIRYKVQQTDPVTGKPLYDDDNNARYEMNPDGSYRYELNADGGEWTYYAVNDPAPLQLTNRALTAETPNSNYVLLKQGCEIEMIYETQAGTRDEPATFYDYDVTNGLIYDNIYAASLPRELGDANGHVFVTSEQQKKENENKTYYVNTIAQGINSKDNCPEAVKYAFGNSESTLMTGYGNLTWEGNEPNKYNSQGNGFQGCTFGLANPSLAGYGTENYADTFNLNLPGPKVFGNAVQIGKKIHEEYGLHFSRSGDTYTLSSVNGTKTGNLESFRSMPNYNNTATIYYNNFWPMDSADSWGTNTHDLKFGSKELRPNRNFIKNASTADKMPESDDGQDHNAYFGMNFQVEFDLPDDYVGPLEYYFFGDDDMWVYLDDKLVCDIGGVHSAVGEYVNLWDHIAGGRPSTDPTDCTSGEAQPSTFTTHKLTFFYTERGASGSTCWMQYTLPNITSTSYKPKDTEAALHIEKFVEGEDKNGEYQFQLTLTPAEGGRFDDNVAAKLYKETTSGVAEEVGDGVFDANGKNDDGVHTLTLRNGESYVITGLPKGTHYTLEEINYGDYVPSFQVETHNGGLDDSVTGTVTTEEGTAWIEGTLDGGTYVRALCTNYWPYELPETGGPGNWYTMAGLPLTAALFCLMYKKKSQGEGAVDQ